MLKLLLILLPILSPFQLKNHPFDFSFFENIIIIMLLYLKKNGCTFVGPQSAPHIALRGVQYASVTRVLISSRVVTLVMLLVLIGGITNLLSTILSMRK